MGPSIGTMEEEEACLRFRNYQPRNAQLKKAVVKPVQAPDTDKELLEVLLKQAISSEEQAKAGVLQIQPRKQNWDLKRDVQKKLDKLKKRTDRAILEIVRDKLSQVPESEQGGANLSRAVMSQ